MTQQIRVTKRNGELELLDWSKVSRVLNWACRGLDVSISQIELDSKIQMFDLIKTSDIHKMIVKAAADLISEENPDYQYAAARLAVFQIRKEAYGQFTPPKLYDHIVKMVNLEKYDPEILDKYTQEEIEEIGKVVDHWRDLNFAYAGIKQIEGKYLVQDRVDNRVYESPQMMYILIAMTLFANEPKETRFEHVKKFYDLVSKFKISLPTPIMGGVRTPTRQFSSCVVIETDDTLNSINASAGSVVNYIARRAGIGLGVGKIRAKGSKVRGGEIYHTGITPFIKHFQTAVKSSSQGGIRGGAATLAYPIWHLEVQDMLVLKNNRGVDDNRARHLDYSVQISKLFYQRLIKKENITLFSPSDVPGLYDSFFADQDKFEELYVKYEQDESVRKLSVPAVELFSTLMQERASTGRIYIMNVDHANTHSSFVDPVKLSNLCVSGDTRILTSEGYKRMDENVGKKFTVWNGDEWSENVEIVKTGENQDMLRVYVYQKDNRSLTTYVDCTPYHKFYTYQDSEVVETRASDLDSGMELEKYSSNEFLGDVQWVVDRVDTFTGWNADTYCVTEPKRNKVVFNGVLTGNCQEITLPTHPLQNVNDENGEIALCTLSAANLGLIDSYDDFEEVCEYMVRALDNLLSYQDYLMPAASHAKKRRALGIGWINLAFDLARRGLKYSDGSANQHIHDLSEAFQYYLLKASVKLARERGACEWFDRTKYSKGILPIDTYKKEVDSIVPNPSLKYDWEGLRADIVKYGLRNSTLSSWMPSESSSIVSNSTNGIEPPRGPVSVKGSKDGILKQIVPDFEKLKDQYEYLWDIPENRGYLEIVSIIQKFGDQSISANTFYDPLKYGGKVPMTQLLKDLLLAYKLGVKTLYYHNTRDSAGEDQKEQNFDTGCESGACAI